MLLVEDNSFETAAVDGTSMFYNSDFIDSLSFRETVGLVAHEVMHVALGHIWRIDKRGVERWNVAADYTINENLIAAGFTLPEGALIDKQYNDLAAEDIYARLPQGGKSNKPNKSGKGKSGQGQPGPGDAGKADPGKCGSCIPAKDEATAKDLKANWTAAISQAVTLSKGTLPGSMQKQLDELLNPCVPWHVLLRDFVEKTARNDYDWTRPSRRYIHRGFCLPSLVSEELPEIVIAIDTSGSIDRVALSHFAAEASNVLGVYDTTIRVIYCDTKVHKEEVFTKADFPLKMDAQGGGGTDFRPVFKYVDKKGYTPACLIYFTDMYGDFPRQEPDYPVMWLTATESQTAPFGQTVIFKMNN
jgi:predicted metal-dependent peptidase